MSADHERERPLDFEGRAAVRAATALLRAIGSTWRIEVVGDDAVARMRAARMPAVFALWHGQLLPLTWHYRNLGVIMLVSEHRDGEIIGRVAKSLGYGLIRGSSTRGGERAILEAVSALRAGHLLAITIDGPRGPARKSAAGPLVAAHRSGAALVPAVVWASAAWKLPSWDSLLIPKPFAKVRIGYGEPIYLRDQSARAAALRTAELENAMAAAEAKLCAE